MSNFFTRDKEKDLVKLKMKIDKKQKQKEDKQKKVLKGTDIRPPDPEPANDVLWEGESWRGWVEFKGRKDRFNVQFTWTKGSDGIPAFRDKECYETFMSIAECLREGGDKVHYLLYRFVNGVAVVATPGSAFRDLKMTNPPFVTVITSSGIAKKIGSGCTHLIFPRLTTIGALKSVGPLGILVNIIVPLALM